MLPKPKKHCLATMGCKIIHILQPCSLSATQIPDSVLLDLIPTDTGVRFSFTLKNRFIRIRNSGIWRQWSRWLFTNPRKEPTHKSHSFENRLTRSRYLLL